MTVAQNGLVWLRCLENEARMLTKVAQLVEDFFTFGAASNNPAGSNPSRSH